MPTPYNITKFPSANLFEKIVVLDTAVDGFLGLAIVVIQFSITFFVLKQKWSSGESFVASSFLSALFSSILYAGGLLTPKYLLVITTLLGVSALITYINNNQGR